MIRRKGEHENTNVPFPEHLPTTYFHSMLSLLPGGSQVAALEQSVASIRAKQPGLAAQVGLRGSQRGDIICQRLGCPVWDTSCHQALLPVSYRW